MKEEIKFVDLFGGIGGFRYGLEQASDKYKCVWYCDIDKYAVQTYNNRYGESYEPRDIRKIKTEDIPEFDMLCGGFPCQAFSIAGKRGGFKDTRGTLFFEIARIIKDKKPKIVLLENVKGLLNHKEGKTFSVILQAMDELGYDCQWMVLNSKFFGVPQNRERVFIIGNIRGQGRPEILPIGEHAEEIQRVSGKEKVKICDNSYKAHRANEIREHKGSPTLTQNMGTGGNNQPMVMSLQKRDINRPSIKKRIDAGLKPNAGSGTLCKKDEAYCLDAGNNQGVARCLDSNMHKGITPEHYYEKNKRNIVAVRSYPRTGTKEQDGDRIQNIEPRKEKVANTLTGVQKDNLLGEYNYGKLRRLTPKECERLQGFPDNWTKNGWDAEKDEGVEISDTQRYRQLGNAVTTKVITFIGKKLIGDKN
jgi:DNA (cytosine-5)-methyltransferase 1